MNTKSFFFLITIIGTLGFVQCCPTKVNFAKNTPFKITDSYYQEWVGGQPGVSGTIVQLTVDNLSDGVTPDSIFFKNRKTNIDMKSIGEKTLWVGNFQNEQKRDINMMENSVDEYGNFVPQKSDSSFKLHEGEIVVSYYENESISYYKLSDVKRIETVFFPATKSEQK